MEPDIYWCIVIFVLLASEGVIIAIWYKRKVKKFVKKIAALTSIVVFIGFLALGIIVASDIRLGIVFLVSLFMACIGYFLVILYLRTLCNMRKRYGLREWDFIDW